MQSSTTVRSDLSTRVLKGAGGRTAGVPDRTRLFQRSVGRLRQPRQAVPEVPATGPTCAVDLGASRGGSPNVSGAPTRTVPRRGRGHQTITPLRPTANGTSQPRQPEVRQDLEPMGDLSRFEIDDLTPEEEGEFFRILEEA